MEDERDDQTWPGLDRRKFLGAFGATAAAGVFLESGGGRVQHRPERIFGVCSVTARTELGWHNLANL